MSTKPMCVMLLALTLLIFAANQQAARLGLQSEECVKCNCKVKLKFPEPSRGEDPSCSVLFTIATPVGEGFKQVAQLSRLRPEGSFNECNAAVVCDRNSEVQLTCRNKFGEGTTKDYDTTLFASTKCAVKCDRVEGDIFPSILGLPAIHGAKVTKTNCEHWERKPPAKPPGKKKDSRNPKGPSPDLGDSLFASFIPASYIVEAPEEDPPDEVVTDQAWWRSYEGDVGSDEGVLTVVSGQADIRSFCTGDESQLTGPGTFSLPYCRSDSLGHWTGAYARRLSKVPPQALGMKLDLRKDGRYIGGDITTPDGTYRITSFNQSTSTTEVRATGTINGKQVDLVLYGKTGKGELVFTGTEGTPGERSIGISGFVSRLYIADNGVPAAVINQPYSFGLMAFSAAGDVTSFALVEGRLPRGISFDTHLGTFTGTPTEAGRFNVRVTVADSAGSTFDQPFTFEVKKLALVFRWLPDAVVGQPYSAQLAVVGGRPPYTFTGSVPAGMTLDPNTGVLSGTPTRLENTTRMIFITDGQKTYEGDRLSLRVRGPTILTTHFLPPAKKNVPYRAKLEAIGSPTITWFLGQVNPDFTIGAQTGELTGTPTKAGTYVLSVTARSPNDDQSRKFAINVSP